MKRLLLVLVAIPLLILAVGCSNDDNPTDSGNGGTVEFTDTTVFLSGSGVWQTTLDASSYDQPAYFTFAVADSGAPKALVAVWDMKFQRTNINLNGGASTSSGGTVVGADLGAIDYDSVTINDTSGAAWETDELYLVINEWLNYNPVTHQLGMTRNVYSMVDATGTHYLKFQIDSLVGAGQPPSMGTVWITYFYQPTANSTDLSGATQTASIVVGSGTGYFDFSSGQQVTPADPSTSTGWDLAFHSYDVMQNCGPNGPGACAAFPAYGELTDPTDIAAFTAQPATAPMFPDFIKSVFVRDLYDDTQDWYDYDSSTHIVSSRGHIYLIKVGDRFCKLRIDGYYGNVGGIPTSGHYTFVWNEL
jgi:hypothetical protein